MEPGMDREARLMLIERMTPALSHDYNNVFGTVSMFAELLLHDPSIEGETADGALMFLPSEAVYAELHAKLPEVVRAGFDARVWIVSPTTCMATLNTMRAVMKDARMREQAGEIRKALRQLHRDVEIIEERAGKLETHLRQAGDDVNGLLTASARAGKRAERLDHFDFEELSPDTGDAPGVVPLQRP